MTRGSCVSRTRRSSESIAVATVRDSNDVRGRNPLSPFGLGRHGHHLRRCRRSTWLRPCLRDVALKLDPWRLNPGSLLSTTGC
jgi:hypothetical protein